MLFCIGCLGAGTHDASHAEIRKNTEKFIKYFNFSLAACRSEIFGFGKSMSIPIDA